MFAFHDQDAFQIRVVMRSRNVNSVFAVLLVMENVRMDWSVLVEAARNDRSICSGLLMNMLLSEML